MGLVFLSEFTFDIVHIAVKLNPADPASRRADYVGEDKMTNRVIIFGSREAGTQ